MCFSATASFVGAGVITAAGVATLALVRDVRQLPFASLPLLFGIHQALEGWTWLELGDREGATLSGPGVHMIRPGVSGGFVSRKDEPRGSRNEAVLGGVEARRGGDGRGVGRA
ncbi:DUF6629 family protein, partial [Gordonia sp. (in: high G+C Gram-positive bacteria)]|uniref:DUF6629 family protein n=1 Tax=Gordonia sp. (in: high G+C Gram-positive bacteria) TaxID=84139 RepID=UPI003C75A51F